MKYLLGFFTIFAIIFVTIALGLPDDSQFKQIFGYVVTGGVLIGFLYFSGIGQYIINFLKKIKLRK